ncbi:MAG: TrkH family potassium uptake protein [Angelakisella sp.]|jgi:trk system potassium uptake protein trkH
MNHRIVLSTTGTVLYIEAAMMLIPLLIAMGFKEHKQALAFLAAILIATGVGFLLRRVAPPQRQDIFSKEGFVIVAMAWLALSLVGALPFTISGAIPHYIDALFETVSGFTTTGATLLQDVEALSYSMQFWRCFTHWIGGMGILVFVTIISAKAPDRTMHILRAEMPGPTMDKIVPKARDGVKILYLIYIVLTLLEFAAFLLADMPIYDAIIHAMSTAGTGGFGMLNSSMAGYAPVCQWIVAFFMVLFAINFNLFFLIIMGQWRTALRSHELLCFLSIIVVASGIIAFNIAPMYGAGDAVRHSFFQVAAIISTTGFATADYTTWPGLSQGIIFVLLFLGGCSGSTAGGLKISRVMLLAQSIRREMQHVLHPRSTRVVRFENKKVDEAVINSCNTYFTLYIVCIAVIFLLICWEPFGLTTNLSAAITCFNNVGPGFGIISPSGNYSAFSPFSKLVLSGAMLLGRLEIYPLLVAITPTAWAKRR